MDKTLKKTDISKRILETRKQTEELKEQLQHLIDSGINSSTENKTSTSHLDKENLELQNNVQIIKSYDTAHSQHVNVPNKSSSSKTNLLEVKKSKDEVKSPKKARKYDVDKAREYIRIQKEKRLEQLKLKNEEDKKEDFRKQKLQELHKKSLEIVRKNVQTNRKRSKSRERQNFVRPIKEITQSRFSEKKGHLTNSRPPLTENPVESKEGKLIESSNNRHKNPNLLYHPEPHYMRHSQEKINENEISPSGNQIEIISGNSSDYKLSFEPKLNIKNVRSTVSSSLEPRKLFNSPESPLKTMKLEIKESDASFFCPDVFDRNITSGILLESLEEKEGEHINNQLKFINEKVVEKPIEALTRLKHLNEAQTSKPINIGEAKKDFVNNILDYKNVQSKNRKSTSNSVPLSPNLPTVNPNGLDKPKLSEIAIGTDNLEKVTKETQTSTELRREYPPWLDEKPFEPNPLNFINTVRRKLQDAINSPKPCVDIGVQSSLLKDNLVNTAKKGTTRKILLESTKSKTKSDLKSFISHKCINLDHRSIDNISLMPKNISSKNVPGTIVSESESESGTSKNIPEISSESGTSLRKNTESVKQNDSIGLNIDRLDSMKLRSHNVNKDTHTIHSKKETQSTSSQDKVISKEIETETNKSKSKPEFSNDQYTSDFQSGSEVVSTSRDLTQKNTSSNSINPRLSNLKVIPRSTEKSTKKSTQEKLMGNETEKHNSTSSKITIRSITTNGIENLNGVFSPKNVFSTSDIGDEEKTVSNRYGSNSAANIFSQIGTQLSRSKKSESQHSKLRGSVDSSKNSDKYISLHTQSHPTISEEFSKSDSNLLHVNTRRGIRVSSNDSRLQKVLPLKEPTLFLASTNDQIGEKSYKHKGERNSGTKNISLRSETNKFIDLNNTNEIHLKFEAEIHLLNDFNESLRQFSEVEKAFNSLKSKNVSITTAKILQNQDTQTSVAAKSSMGDEGKANSVSENSQLSTINYSRGFMVNDDSSSLNLDNTVSKFDETDSEAISSAGDGVNVNIANSFSNFENLQTNNFAGMTIRMFEQLIKDEDVRLENLKTILKIREQALLDRTKGELAWLEIQRKHLRETGKLQEASMIKKKQRGILVNHQKERHEMQRLKQMQKAASLERKIILKEQKNLIKHQLSTDTMLSKIKLNTPKERRLSGPLKVIQSHTESIKSETSFSRRSSNDREREVYSINSHTQSVVSRVSEVSGDEVVLKEGTSKTNSVELINKLGNETSELHISQMKRKLLMREAALQKRRKAAEELLQWHRKLLEEEKRIEELESTANSIISQIPNNVSTIGDVAQKYQFNGAQLNQLWFNLTGCKEKKFSESKIYPMSQIALVRFCKSAREYSTKTKKILKTVSDSEGSEFSEARTNENFSKNIPSHKDTDSASIKTVSEQSHESSMKNDSAPVTTTNDYTLDFDVESMQELNIQNMDVVDKNLNQLIDDFSKIQDDISSLSINQSMKFNLNLDFDKSINSEKTESDVDVSVIETARTSQGKVSEEKELEGISDHVSLPERSKSIEVNNLANSEKDNTVEKTELSLESKIPLQERNKETKSKVISSVLIESIDKTSPADTYDKVSSLIEENIGVEGQENLNKSQEILEELDHIESQKVDIYSNKESTSGELQVVDNAKDNLNKSEEILLQLSASCDKSSIITSENHCLQPEIEAKVNDESELLELQSINEANISFIEKSSIEDDQVITENTTPREKYSISTQLHNKSTKKPEDQLTENEYVGILLELSEQNDDSEVISKEHLTNESSKEIESTNVTNKISDVYSSGTPSLVEESISKNVTPEENVITKSISEPQEESKSVKDTATDVNNEISDEILEVAVDSGMKELELEEKVSVDQESKIDLKTKSTNDSQIVSEVDEETECSDASVQQNDSKSISSRTDQNESGKLISSDQDVEKITSKISENFESKEVSDQVPSEINSKLEEKENTEDIFEQIHTIPQATDIDKSPVVSGSENQATPISKEEINSYEEKDVDSLSSSCSQTSIISGKEENHISKKSKSSSSEEKSPKNGTLNVKKRVSEIMADANNASRGDKSPKLQDFYTTTYDLVSPTNSPELGSPTEEYKFMSAKSIFGTEAEELLRKQLAIEQEIKQITEQQQKEQLPYLFVREIPNKPPPPYTPPSSLSITNAITIIPSVEEIEEITKYSAKILHKAYLSNNLDNISISENTLSLISKNVTKECYKFVFDLCKEISKEHYKQFEKDECPVWLQVKKNRRLASVKPLDINGLEKYMINKLKEYFGYEKPMRRENAIIKWSRKKRDHVDEILVMESQAEEGQWTNYDKDELLVMNDVTNEIMNMLLKDTSEVISKIFSRQTS